MPCTDLSLETQRLSFLKTMMGGSTVSYWLSTPRTMDMAIVIVCRPLVTTLNGKPICGINMRLVLTLMPWTIQNSAEMLHQTLTMYDSG